MASSSLPLNCTICPKKPIFSDVSHLLTHVASKGHLSHYYKVKVRAGNDDVSRQAIEAYDQWYLDWNVEGLMSDRLACKEQKRKRGGLATSSRPTKKMKATKAEPAQSPFDPRLAMSYGQQQSFRDYQEQNPTTLYIPGLTVEQRPLPSMPQLHVWSTKFPTSFHALPLEYPSPPAPSARRFSGQYPQAAPLAPMLRSNDTAAFVYVEDERSEATKLKGVLWPGMNIFDAATTPMRKKRNQKKETSVVERLEKNASGVEANEMIFTPKGSLYKERPISGQVDFNSSPYKMSQFSSPPKRKAAPRPALAGKDPNRPVRSSKTTQRLPENFVAAQGGHGAANVAKQLPKKRKRTFAVLDEREPEEDNPKTIKLLTSTFHYEAQPRQQATSRPGQHLDGPLAAMYQPAYQHRYLMDAFDTFQQPTYGISPYQFYGYSGGYDIPGYFSTPAAYHGLPVLDQAQVLTDIKKLTEVATSDPSASTEDDGE